MVCSSDSLNNLIIQALKQESPFCLLSLVNELAKELCRNIVSETVMKTEDIIRPKTKCILFQR